MAITFTELIEEARSLLKVSDQSLDPYKSTLRKFVTAAGWELDEEIPRDFGSNLETTLDRVLPTYLNERQQQSARSTLRTWHHAWSKWVRGYSLPTEFQAAFRILFERSGTTQKELARKLGISDTSVRDYLAGRHEPAPDLLLELEEYFGLEAGVLSGKVRDDRNGPAHPFVPVKDFPTELQGTASSDSRARTKVRQLLPQDYRALPREDRQEKLRVAVAQVLSEQEDHRRRTDGFAIKEESWNDGYRQEWRSLKQHKTGFERDDDGEERIAMIDDSEDADIEAEEYWGEASERIYRDFFEAFYGFAVLDSKERKRSR